MEIKLRMKTAPGWGNKIADKFQLLLLGKKTKVINVYVNDDDSTIIWHVEVTPKELIYMTKRVNMYDWWVKQVLSTKALKKIVYEEEWPILESIMKDHTNIDIVKQATAQELVESKLTWWDRVKTKWRKK